MMDFWDVFVQNLAIWIPSLTACVGSASISAVVTRALLKAAQRLKDSKELEDLRAQVEINTASNEALRRTVALLVDAEAKVKGFTEARLNEKPDKKI
jgi:hypothetical protein